MVHEFTICTFLSGEVCEFECYPIPNKNILNKIVELDEDDYKAIALARIEEIYPDAGKSITISNLTKIDSTTIKYLFDHNCFAVDFYVSWDIVDSDGNTEAELGTHFYLPLT